MLKEADILHECGAFWVVRIARCDAENGVKRHRPGFYVMECGITHSKVVAIFGSDGDDWLQRAKNECERRACVRAYHEIMAGKWPGVRFANN